MEFHYSVVLTEHGTLNVEPVELYFIRQALIPSSTWPKWHTASKRSCPDETITYSSTTVITFFGGWVESEKIGCEESWPKFLAKFSANSHSALKGLVLLAYYDVYGGPDAEDARRWPKNVSSSFRLARQASPSRLNILLWVNVLCRSLTVNGTKHSGRKGLGDGNIKDLCMSLRVWGHQSSQHHHNHSAFKHPLHSNNQSFKPFVNSLSVRKRCQLWRSSFPFLAPLFRFCLFRWWRPCRLVRAAVTPTLHGYLPRWDLWESVFVSFPWVFFF